MLPPTSLNVPRAGGWDATKLPDVHPAFYIAAWIFFSNLTIIFNKWLLDTAGFRYRMYTTTAVPPSRMCRHTIKLTGRVYLRTILPIGVLYTLSLLCSNLAYLYLSVPFIQMLKALGPVSTLFLSFFLGFDNPKVSKLWNVVIIAGGVLISSLGEVRFDWTGFGFQMAGTLAESLRLLLIQGLLSKGDHGEEGGRGSSVVRGIGMHPLVGLYYYAPVCALLNGLVALVVEMPTFDPADLQRVGWAVLGLNGVVAFMLNVASVFLIGRTSALAMSLTGILKSILLVAAAMVIWSTPVTLLQAGGYLVALVAMFYYSSGGLDAAKSHLEWIAVNSRALFSPEQPYQAVPPNGEDGGVADLESGEAGIGSDAERGETDGEKPVVR